LIIQILLFRRSTIVWILTSATFLYVLRNPRVRLLYLIAAFVLIPVFSYGFGKYGAFRSNLSTSFIINDLEASAAFTNTGISPAHYLTYLYIASPLANLQKNIDDADGFLNKKDFKSFIFYAIVPESLTIRLARHLNLSPPECSLITHNLIVGSFFMVGFYTLGWPGMLGLLMFLVVFIFLCQSIITKWDTFRNTTSAILLTTVALLIFTNFLNRLDVILMLFIYPVLFHFLYRRKQDKIHQE
jgi:hypothetical protein